MCNRKTRTIITNPAIARTTIPRPRGTVASSPPPEPVTIKPKSKPGEIFQTGPSVVVTGKPRTQRPAGGEF